jgi:general secretion pathway protein M
MNKLRAWYAGLERREQRVVAVGSVTVAVLILVFGILLPLQGSVSSLRRHNAVKREDLAWMRVNAAEIRASGGGVPSGDGGEAPVVVVGRTAGEEGLTDSLRGMAPNGTGVHVQLNGAPFDAVVPWLTKLDEHHGLAIESITVDRTANAGQVNASITFTQSRP